MHLLFDDVVRTYTEPALGSESHFHFYNRSALPAADRLREMLQRWIGRLPRDKQKDIVNRMRHQGTGSRANDRSFDSAFFELALHEFLLGTGAEVSVEPKIAGRTPNFSAVEAHLFGDAQKFYIEALDISTAGNTELEVSWNEKRCEDILNEIESPDFYLHVEASGVLQSMPRKQALKGQFERLLDQVDYDVVLAQYGEAGNWEALPSTVFKHGDWELEGRLLPVSPSRRPKPTGNRFIGSSFGGAGRFDDVGKPRNRLEVKAKRYKHVPRLIIAISEDEWGIRMNEVLFGTQTYTFYINSGPRDKSPVPEPHPSQRMDGFWCNSSRPQNQHVVGVLLFRTLYPHCVHRAQVTFYSNPYVDAAMPFWTRAIPHTEYLDGKITISNGAPPSAYMTDHEAIDDLFEGTPLSRTAGGP